MSRKKYLFASSPYFILAFLITGCTATGNVPTALPPAATVLAAVPFSGTAAPLPPTILPTNTLPAPAATEPLLPEPPTEIVPTPTLGPALSHLAPGQKIDITFINMLDVHQGWGIGGVSQASDHVLRTEDGGKTWRDVTPPQPAADAGSLLQATGAFRDASNAWVVFAPQGSAPAGPFALIWSTHDGGTSWQYFSLDISGIGQEFFTPSNMTFVDDRHGWFLAHVGVGMMHDYVAIVATSDGGASWQVRLDPYSDGGIQSCSKNAMIYADDAQTGWLTPDCLGVDLVPHLFKTLDGGSTWTRLDLPEPSDAAAGFFDTNACGMHFPVVFSPSSELFAMQCRDMATFKIEKDYLYMTSDGGQSWQSAPYPGGALVFFGVQEGLALNRSISITSDGGQHWKLYKQVNWDGQFNYIDALTAWAVARDGGQIALVTTGDSGTLWKEIKPVVAP
jgi:photosystem II stability/assembly factor-like uncharacterized protein